MLLSLDRRLMRFLKKLSLITILLLFGGAGWAAVYAYDKGFTKKWRRLVNNEFQKYGIEASIGRLTLDPFQGLVARDVKFYQDESRKSLLAAVSQITLDIDLIRLLEKDVFLNTIDIRDANLSLPVDPEDPRSDRLEIQNFNARILMPGNRIEISQAHGNLQGVDVDVQGSLIRPSDKKEFLDGENNDDAVDYKQKQLEIIKERRQVLDFIIKEMGKLEFSRKDRPRIDLELSGDLDNLENLRGKIRVTAQNLKRGGYECSELKALLELAHSRVLLKELKLKDRAGELVAQAEHVIGSDRIHVAMQSSIDLHGLVSSVIQNPSLGEVVFYDAPRINLEGDILLDGEPITAKRLPLECVGSVHCGRFTSRGGIIFDGLDAHFSVNRDQFYFRNIRIGHRSGALTANGIYNPDGLRYDALIKLDPAVFVPFSKKERTRDFLSKVKLNEDSTIYLKVHGTGPEFKMSTWHTYGELDVRNIHFNGEPLEHIQADLEIDRQQRHYRNVRLTRPEGSATASLVSYNTDTRIARVEKAAGSVYPAEIARYFSAKLAKNIEPYRFSAPPSLSVSGTIDGAGKEATDFHVVVVAQRPVEYDFLGKSLTFDKGTAALHFTGNDLSAAHIDAEIFNGRMTTDFSVNSLSGKKNYTARVEVNSLRFRDIAARYGYHENTEGELTGHFNFTGKSTDRYSITGKGVAIIVNGDVFAIPIFGPLSKLISDLVSRKNSAGYSIAREASANFTMIDGVITTHDFEALTNSFRMRGSGTIDTRADAIDFNARLNARGAPGILLLPVSKLFEYTCRGSLENPVWGPKIMAGGAATSKPR